MSADHIEILANKILSAYDGRMQIPSICAQEPGFDLAQAYAVTAAIRDLRHNRGEIPIGRKLGFTNTTIWDEYGVYAPIWGYVYNTTVVNVAPGAACKFDLTRVVEPRIEPEITLSFKASPEAGMNEREILECIDWVAHGFEVVQSLFPGWRVAAPDTIAAFGLHGALMLGPRHAVTSANIDAWMEMLTAFKVSLFCDGHLADSGSASNVLGGPLSALRHAIGVLAMDGDNPQISAGEIVTTGTVTRAFPMSSGQVWCSSFSGAPFVGLTVEAV